MAATIALVGEKMEETCRRLDNLLTTQEKNKEIIKAISEYLPKIERSYIIVDYHSDILDLLKGLLDVVEAEVAELESRKSHKSLSKLFGKLKSKAKTSKAKINQRPVISGFDEAITFDFKGCISGYDDIREGKARTASQTKFLSVRAGNTLAEQSSKQ